MNNELAAILAAIAAEEESDELLRGRQVARSNPTSETPTGPAPLFSSAEIGTVDASTVVVTFDQNITASNYATGVTIKKNTVTQTISSATRQTDHAVVHYVLSVAAEEGDTLTWQYTGGNIAAEDDGAALGTVTAQTITNNITGGLELPEVASATLLLNLQADTLAVGNGNPVSTWPDASGNGRDFTGGVGTARIFHTDANGGYVDGNGVDQFLTGSDWGDNLASFAIFNVIKDFGWGGQLLSKITADETDNYFTGIEQKIDIQGEEFKLLFALFDTPETLNSYGYGKNSTLFNNDPCVLVSEKISNTELHIYRNGALVDGDIVLNNGTITDFGNSEPWHIGIVGGPGGIDDSGYSPHAGSAYMVYQITDLENWPTDRAAIEAWLAARYGITLP